MVWLYLHLPFVMSFVLASGTLARLVVAHDCPNADPEFLTERYAAESDAELQAGLRWFYSSSLGIALLCMTGIALSHDHKEIHGQHIKKWHRLGYRIAVAIVLICLPLAESLDSLQLVGTVTALVVSVLAVEYWGSTTRAEGFWYDDKKCVYTANSVTESNSVDRPMDGVPDLEKLAEDKGGRPRLDVILT